MRERVQRAVVMGASRGLGRAVAERLAHDGMSVHLVARDPVTLERLATELPNATWHAADVTEPAQLADAMTAALREGPVDVLLANGGGPRPGRALDLSDADWELGWRSVLLPTIQAIRSVMPSMIEQRHGRIVVVGSSGMKAPIPGLALSNTYRAAVVGFVKTLAAEVAENGITVNIAAPGRFDTERVALIDQHRAQTSGRTPETIRAESILTIPTGRYGDPTEFANAVSFLANRQTSFLTGQIVLVDGGMVTSI
jgi:3-oxoacyl-[acyl-carrier protein] reductase